MLKDVLKIISSYYSLPDHIKDQLARQLLSYFEKQYQQDLIDAYNQGYYKGKEQQDFITKTINNAKF